MAFSKQIMAWAFGLFTLSASAQENATPRFEPNGVARPKLVVGLVIDQMRWDYLYRYFNRYGDGGFKRLMKEGYQFENTMIPYVPSVTAAGHTCLYTGTVPAIHGIIANDWIDRASDKRVYCSADPKENSVGTFSKLGKMSPRNMLVNTIGDELRLATNFRSRVFGMALKDRGGIFPAGHAANAAYWMDDSTGRWISSTYYMKALPSWVDAFNKRNMVDSLMNIDWNPIYPMASYLQSTGDDKAYEKPLYHEDRKTFPHAYRSQVGKNYLPLRQSPYGNTVSFDFAEQLLVNEKLGKGEETDMLCLSMSATDYVSHRFGPNSIEVEDTYLRLDRELAAFLNFLDREYGKNNYLLFLSADHGAPQSPGFLKEHGMPAGNLLGADLATDLNDSLAQKFKVKGLVEAIYEYQVYLDTRKIAREKLDLDAVKNAVVESLRQMPEVFSACAFSSFDKWLMPSVVKEKFINGYFPSRSGDIQFILKPQYTDVLSSGTEHGTWYTYDAHIPLIWFGWNIRQGKTNREVYMTDVAPTLAALLHIQMPNGCIGKVLTELVDHP